MKFAGIIAAALFAIAQAQQPAQGSTAAAPSQAPGAAPLAGGSATPTNGASADPSAKNSTASAQSVEQVLMSCATPHTFTPAEIKSMNQVLGIMILLLQYQLFVNDDKSGEQETYNQLLPIYRSIMNLFKNMNNK